MEKVLSLSSTRQVQALKKVRIIFNSLFIELQVGDMEISWPAGHILLELPRLIRQHPHLAPEVPKHEEL